MPASCPDQRCSEYLLREPGLACAGVRAVDTIFDLEGWAYDGKVCGGKGVRRLSDLLRDLCPGFGGQELL